ncbi:hypothetical protein Tsubulata_019024 [Turnera subulata]|uniref:F-box domain-containing protein n=1 Tax=Turnera subulata TaxID=218843 RepID=A0A9Q0JFS8_9ROSI|nr:hypothetical protein Tsubulata_019024 [Turnera subulata]
MESSRSKNQRNQPPGGAEPIFPNLPEEIIVEIFSRLPAKSLGRFRCVCKLWLSIISSAQFAKTHLELALQNKTLYSERQRLILSSHSLYSVDGEVVGCGYGDRIVAVELEHPLKADPTLSDSKDYYFKVSEDEDDNPVMVRVDVLPSTNWFEILGSCNGLVCIGMDEGTFFLFNPTTRKFKRIPTTEESLPGSPLGSVVGNAHGFGFDSVSDDYKLVRIDVDVILVYSLRTDSWRVVGNFPYEHYLIDSGVFLNGAIHWVVSIEEEERGKSVVIVFDLADEIFREMPAPDDADMGSDIVMGILNGCLCILHCRNNMHDYFWMMRDYGMDDSWTKVNISFPYICMKPLYMGKNGESLLLVDGELLSYNFEKDRYRELEVHGIPSGVGFEADTYLESLVSPVDYGDKRLQN